MALVRGESIGTAYIRILAEGSGLDKSVKDELAKTEDLFRSGGGNNATAYKEGYDDARAKHNPLEDVVADVRKAFGAMDADAKHFGPDFQRDLSDSITNSLKSNLKGNDAEARELADRIVTQFVDRIQRGFGAADMESSLRPMLARAVKDIQREQKLSAAEFERNWRAAFGETVGDAQKAVNGISSEFSKLDRNTRSLTTTMHKLATEMDSIDTSAVGKGIRDLGQDINAWRQGAKGAQYDTDKFTHRISALRDEVGLLGNDLENHPIMDAFGRDLDVMAAKLVTVSSKMKQAGRDGQSFWKDLAESKPRNDFLNIVTSVIGGIGTIGETIGLQLPKALGLSEDAFGSLVPKIAATSSVIVVLIALLGPVIAGVTALGGAVIALAGSLVSAAAGGLAVFGGVLLAAGGALVTIVLALKGLTNGKFSTELKVMFGGLTDQLKQLEAIAGAGLFAGLASALPDLTKGMSALASTIGGISLALGDTIAGFGEVVASPSFQSFSAILGVALPHIVELMGKSFNNTFRGMLGMIEAILPSTQEFAGWLAGITNEFANFTASTSGQSSLQRFFAEASQSARVLGDLIGATIVTLGKLVNASAPSGDTLVSDLAAQLRQLGDWLSAHPDMVSGFFGDSVKAAEAAGRAILSIVQMFGKLNTEANRQTAINLFEALATAIQLAGDMLGQLTDLLGPVTKIISTLIGKVVDLADKLAGPIAKFGALWVALQIGMALIRSTAGLLFLLSTRWIATAEVAQVSGTKMSRALASGPLRSGIAGVAGMISATLVPALTKGGTAANGLGDALTGALLGFSVGGPVGAVLGAGIGLLTNLSAAGFDASDAVKSLNEQIAKTGPIQSQANTVVQEQATLLAQMGISADTYTKALEGNDRAFGEVLIKAKSFGIVGQLVIGPIDQARAAAEKWKTSMQQVADATTHAGSVVRKMGAPVDEFGRSLDDTNGFVSDSQQRTDDLVTSVLNLNNGFSDTAQSASQLSDALDKLISPELDLDQANIAWQRSLTALDTALKTGAHTLNINTKAGQDHRDAIDASVAALKTQLKSEADASRGSQFLTNHLRTGIAAILDSAKAAHLNKDEVAAMLAKYNLTPKLIRTLVEAETNKAKGAVDDYNKNSVGKIPKTATTDVSVTGVDVASAGVDALTRNLQTLDEMSVTADATVTVTRIDKVLTQLGTGIFHAAGGVFSGPTRAIIGEAGPEAVVPLSRPLSQVDPAVRWLSAIAQGKASAGLAGSGARTIEIGGITIVTPATDPVAVATETVNVLTARSSL